MKRFSLIFSLLALALLPTAARASTAAVGDLEFNSYSASMNVFAVNNFTGSNNLGFFPVADNVSFDNIVLNATESDSTVLTFNLGDLPPGNVVSSPFSSSINFTQVIFTATLNPSTFMLTDTSTFVASPSLSFTLLPSSGTFLVADADFGIINAESLSPTPEPSTFILFAFGLFGMFAVRARKFLYFHRS
jgi:hypothetical protein